MHTVLVVEADDHKVRELLTQLLLDAYEVLTARADRAARLRLADGAAGVAPQRRGVDRGRRMRCTPC